MNLNRFIDSYGNYSFDELEFTEIDNVIFASLSYLNLDGLVSSHHFSPRKLVDVAKDFFEKYSKKDRNIYATRKAIKILANIQNTKRYKDLLLYNYIYESGNEEQFSAFTIEINSRLVYVSFEGTDQLVSGWREDFMFSYCFPTISQKRAINYINKHFIFRNKKIILGGHSKGGNLAVVAGMYANFFVKRRIIKIYNNDGPGFLNEQLVSKNYLSVKDKIISILPNHSMVGILLKHDNEVIVIRSMKKGLLSHDVMSWVVKDKEFERAELSLYSSNLSNKVYEWLEKYDLDTRKKFVESLFSVFDRAGIYSLLDVVENKKLILKFILETKDIDSDIRKMIKDFIIILFQVSNEARIEEFKSIFFKESKSH